MNTSISEGTCSSILEAFSYNIPVLVRDNKGNTELVQDGENGFTFNTPEEFIDKYTRLFDPQNEELVSKMKKNAQDTILKRHNI